MIECVHGLLKEKQSMKKQIVVVANVRKLASALKFTQSTSFKKAII